YNYQSAVQHRKLLKHGRQRCVEFFKVFKRKDFARNLAEYSRDSIFLIEKIRAKPGDVWDFVTEVHVAGFFERFDLVLRRDFVQYGFERVAFEWRKVHALQFAVDAEHRRIA